ncbi:hypothetical protein IAI18_16160 [Acetobacteraceae bacterium H6797]|nr:hypothetical protein [Acetobacteraceae bacterium H6797]
MRSPRIALTAFLLAALSALPLGPGALAAQAEPPLPSAALLVSLCRSSSLAEAAQHGERLGWRLQENERLENWRANFVQHNGGTVQVIGWRQGEDEKAALLSFWIAEGPNAHRACYYMAAHDNQLLDGLTDVIGRPESLDKVGDMVTAFWTQGPMEVEFLRTGNSTLLNIAHKPR